MKKKYFCYSVFIFVEIEKVNTLFFVIEKVHDGKNCISYGILVFFF